MLASAGGDVTPSLLSQSVIWFIPYVLLVMLVLYSMMEFTAALLLPSHRRPRPAVSRRDLHNRLQSLDLPERARLQAGQGGSDFEIVWDVVDPVWAQDFARVRLDSVRRAFLVLDEERHEVRWHEYIRSANPLLGFVGWRPVIQSGLSAAAGFIGDAWAGQAYGILSGFPPQIAGVLAFSVNAAVARRHIAALAEGSGWTLRPMLLWFQANRKSLALARLLLPRRVRLAPARRLWGVIYPSSYAAAILYLIAVAWPLGREAWLALVLVTLGWWGIWGLLTLVLLRWPPVRRSSRRSR